MKKAPASRPLVEDGVFLLRIRRASSLLLGTLVGVTMLSACNEKDQVDPNGGLSSNDGSHEMRVVGTIRPALDTNLLEKMKQEEATEFERRRLAAIEAQKAAQQQQPLQFQDPASLDAAKRDLPPVDTSPIAGIKNMLGMGGSSPPSSGGSSNPSPPASVPSPPPTYSYGGYGQPAGGSLIPPPPAVSVSATMTPPPADMAYAPPPYGYPPYGYPPQNGYYPPAQAAPQPQQPAHPSGSLFSNGGSSGSSSGDDESAKKKKEVALITPTGMDSRSPFKQRDDLKVLVKGALANSPNLRDQKVQQMLQRVDVGLPSESSKGNLSLTQRQIDNLFKTPPIDKRVLPVVKRVETEVAQAYYRYLHYYNKYILAQQQVSARKQEIEVAETNAERQRATADLAAAQNDAEASKDEVRAAQTDLASLTGPQAARSIITKVSGVAPSADALASGDNNDAGARGNDGLMNSVASALNPMNMFNVFGHKGGGKPPGNSGGGASSGSSPDDVASSPAPVEAPRPKKNKKESAKAPKIASVAPQVKDSGDSDAPAPVEKAPSPPPASSSGVTFELKTVQTTPRKSILKVAIKNNSGDNINIDTDQICVAEGDHRLAEAAVRAEFDTSLVQPNQEVTGTITIFGRPWNDKLSVSLSEGGKTIQLHR